MPKTQIQTRQLLIPEEVEATYKKDQRAWKITLLADKGTGLYPMHGGKMLMEISQNPTKNENVNWFPWRKLRNLCHKK